MLRLRPPVSCELRDLRNFPEVLLRHHRGQRDRKSYPRDIDRAFPDLEERPLAAKPVVGLRARAIERDLQAYKVPVKSRDPFQPVAVKQRRVGQDNQLGRLPVDDVVDQLENVGPSKGLAPREIKPHDAAFDGLVDDVLDTGGR